MIQIIRNEKWKYPSIKLNGTALSDYNETTKQMKYHTHKINIKSDINIKDVTGIKGTFKSGYFLGTLDDSDETISFLLNEVGLRSFKYAQVQNGDMVEIKGSPYVNPKDNTLLTIMNVKKVFKDNKGDAPAFVLDWINHFSLYPDHKDNTVENFVDTFLGNNKAWGITEEQLKELYTKFVKSK